MKLTDELVIKALECCKSFDDLRACYKCPALENGDCSNGKVYISNFILDKALDLINRQKAEIEELKEVTTNTINTSIEFGLDKENQINTAKAEAIKEFWSKRKTHTRKMKSSDFGGEFWDKAVLVEDGDNLVKEMVGDTE